MAEIVYNISLFI